MALLGLTEDSDDESKPPSCDPPTRLDLQTTIGSWPWGFESPSGWGMPCKTTAPGSFYSETSTLDKHVPYDLIPNMQS